jgi:hypothetical protein
VRTLYHAPPGILSAASVAVQLGNTLYVGSAMGDRLLEVDLSVVTKANSKKEGLHEPDAAHCLERRGVRGLSIIASFPRL